jgi:integrase/recombinase XerC
MAMSLNFATDELAAFLTGLRIERRLSRHTVEAYERDLKAFFDYCERESVLSLAALDSFHVRRFAAESHRRGLSPRSIARRLSAVRSFLRAEV